MGSTTTLKGTSRKQQTNERYYFEKFRKAYPLPAGVITHGDKPDVIVDGAQKLGIEMRRFYVTEGTSPNSEQVQRKRRETAVLKGHHLYQQNAGKNIGFTFSFDKRHPIQDVDALAKQLAALARRVDDRNSGQIGRDVFEDIPEIDFAYLHARELQYSAEPDPLFPNGRPDLLEGLTAYKEYSNRREARALREGVYKPLQ